jgi:hypothetical protein
MLLHEDPKVFAAKCAAAALGCAECSGKIKNPPVGEPFSAGPWRGRYLCPDCWTIFYAEHPEHLADQESIDYCRKEAERIKSDRLAEKGEILYQENGSKVVLTGRGTILFHLEPAPGRLQMEFDAERFALLLRSLQIVDSKNIMGFSLTGLQDSVR